MKRTCLLVPILIIACTTGYAAEPGGDTNVLLQKTGTWGGLGLVVGAKSPKLCVELIKDSSLYVQVLQPEVKTALSWGRKTAVSKLRNQLGIRNAAFNPEHYGSDLFNLIVVENAAALGKAKMADLCRILVPNGVVAFKKAPKHFADDAQSLEMTALTVDGFATVLRKPVKPAEWKLPIAQKWQAGPRSQIANGYAGITTGDGKLFYLERMEIDQGDLKKSIGLVVARDAHNGRTLWTWRSGRWTRYSGIAVTDKGHVFVLTGSQKVICLDSATGKVLFTAAEKVGREARIWRVNDDFFYVRGYLYSSETGKRLW